MANQFFSRVIPKTQTLTSFFSRSLSTTTVPSFLHRLRPLSAAAVISHHTLLLNSFRSLSTRATTSSLNDPNPNWSNRPPKETIMLDGCDFEHWLVIMEKPEGDPTRDEIIDGFIKTFAQVIGSEEEARMKIYSVSTRHYFAFGALCSEELSNKIKDLPNVRWVLPDSYLNVREKDYGGEPFINGQAVPYDPKYHEEWVKNNARANERNGRNNRPRNDRPRNFDRRRENVVNRDMQTRPPPPPHAQTSGGGFPPNNAGGGYPHNNAGRYAPAPPRNQSGYAPAPPRNQGGYAPNNTAGGYPSPPNMNSGPPPPPNSGYGPNGGMPQNNYPGNMGGVPQNNYPGNMGGVPQNQNMGGFPPNAGWTNNQ